MKATIIGSFEEPRPPATAKAHKHNPHLFNPDAAYVKAINNLQATEWRINSRVLEKAQRSEVKKRYTFSLDEEREASKILEWNFTIDKANILKTYESIYQEFEVDYRGRIYNTEPFLNYQSNDLAKGLLLFKKAKKIDEAGKFWLAVHTAAIYDMSYDIDKIPDWCEQDYRSFLLDEGLDNISVSKMTLNDRAEWTNQYMEKILEWACLLYTSPSPRD